MQWHMAAYIVEVVILMGAAEKTEKPGGLVYSQFLDGLLRSIETCETQMLLPIMASRLSQPTWIVLNRFSKVLPSNTRTLLHTGHSLE